MSPVVNGTQTRTYEGRTLEEILPRIREELGPDAVITRQREGLRGGIAGFFQKHFIEVEARPGRRVDLYDEGGVAEPDDGLVDPITSEGMSSPAIKQIRDQASPFADLLNGAMHDERENGGNGFVADELASDDAAEAARKAELRPARR